MKNKPDDDIENKIDKEIGSPVDIFDRVIPYNSLVEKDNFWNWFIVRHGADNEDLVEEKFVKFFAEYSMHRIFKEEYKVFTQMYYLETKKNKRIDFQVIHDLHIKEYDFIINLFQKMHDMIFIGWHKSRKVEFEEITNKFIDINMLKLNRSDDELDLGEMLSVDHEIMETIFNTYSADRYYEFFKLSYEFWDSAKNLFDKRWQNNEL
jgi:hypothetical protein